VRGFSFFIFLVLGLGLNKGYTKEPTSKDILNSYVLIQEALASDNLSLAQTKAQDLQIQLKSDSQNLRSKDFKDLKNLIILFLKSKTIEEARNEFKKLSSPFVEWIVRNKEAGFEVVHCPMAGAKWVQKKGEILNPYYGKEMLSCGEKVK
jgi:hypothetical protein